MFLWNLFDLAGNKKLSLVKFQSVEGQLIKNLVQILGW